MMLTAILQGSAQILTSGDLAEFEKISGSELCLSRARRFLEIIRYRNVVVYEGRRQSVRQVPNGDVKVSIDSFTLREIKHGLGDLRHILPG